MLISYPILPAPTASNSDAELEAFISKYADSTKGLYPVSFKDRWHGGIHLKPGDAPIRAIADGEVVAYRVASTPETYKQQDYDTSFVLLKHTTETGEKTPVVFYSLYMHLASVRDLGQGNRLAQLPDWLRKSTGGKVQTGGAHKLWRKDILGFGGQLYGNKHFHFEIFATDISDFWKDSKAYTQGAKGSPDFFGAAQFVIPAGTMFVAEHPDAKKHKDKKLYVGNQVEPEGTDGSSGGEMSIVTPVPIDAFIDGVGTTHAATDGRLFVELAYIKGKRIATSYQLDVNGNIQSLGAPVVQDDYEYNLYSIASALYPDCPSAGYEYLRFGQVLGPDTTTHNHHWQFVRYGKDPDAVGYVDLAASDVTKLSDADFPFWQGWQKVDESTNIVKEDGICDVPALQALLNIPTDKQGQSLLDPPDFANNASDPAVAKKLRHLVCQFNSEWDDTDLDTRYKRWYAHGQPLEDPASQKDFKDHIKKMVFWSSTGLDRKIWHFHPLQFIAHYRKCGWLSLDELSQMLPRIFFTYSSEKGSNVMHRTQGKIDYPTSNGRFKSYTTNFNKTMLKYGIQSPERVAHFLAQMYTETDVIKTNKEYGEGKKNRKGKWPAPAMEYYTAFYGRGIMQLTWPSNYSAYGVFRNSPNNSGTYSDTRITQTSNHYWSDPREKNGSINNKMLKQWAPRYDPETIVSDNYSTCDSGGFYWVSKYIGSNKYNINQTCDENFSTQSIGRVSILVNGGGNGYFERQGFARFAHALLSDEIKCGAEDVLVVHGIKSASVKIDYAPQRP